MDDFYSMDRSSDAEHAMQCFERMVRCLLGQSAVSDAKSKCGMPQTVLGVSVTVSEEGVELQPDQVKRAKWVNDIQQYLKAGWHLPSIFLCARLQFAVSRQAHSR